MVKKYFAKNKTLNFFLFFISIYGSCFSQDSLNFNRIKDIGIYVTENINTKYPEVDFLKYRIISPTFNIFDKHQGNENDSILNIIKYFDVVNNIDNSNRYEDSLINLLYLQSQMLKAMIDNYTPLSASFISFYDFKDSVITENLLDFQNNKFILNTPTNFFPFKKDTLFAFSVLNEIIKSNNVNFILNEKCFLSNINKQSIDSIYINFDDNEGYRLITFDTPVHIVYNKDGEKLVKIRLKTKGNVYVSSCNISIQTNNAANRITSSNEEPGAGPFDISTSMLGTNVSGKYAIWYSTCNSRKVLRKPYLISVGLNPNKASGLTSNLISANNPINLSFYGNNISIPTSYEFNGGWRGTFYEAYNGNYNEYYSKDEFSSYGKSDNGNKLLDKLRDEGYDIVILTYDDGKDFTINNAALFMELIQTVNTEKFNNGYYFENVASGYSGGGVTIRLALALMESRYKQGIGPNPHTKLMVNYDGENQGVNSPIGIQHYVNYQKSPSNIIPSLNPVQIYADQINQLVMSFAHSSITGNTANEFLNYNALMLNNAPHFSQQILFNLLSNIPQNSSNGYPEFCRKISLAQGSGLGYNNRVTYTDPKLFHSNLGGSNTRTANSLPSSCGGSYTWYGPTYEKTATARVWSPINNQNLFDAEIYLNPGFTFFPKICFYTIFTGCKCMGPYTISLPISINQTHVPAPNNFKNYDNATASTLSAHLDIYKNSAYDFYNKPIMSSGPNHATAFCEPTLFAFAPTSSVLDLHDPNNGYQTGDQYLSPTNLNLMYIAPTQPEPNRRFGFPHLNYPNNHYSITPFDAIYSIGDNNGTFSDGGTKPDNQMHVDDPQDFIGKYLSDIEVAPTTLYLSNRDISQSQSNYKAEFEARERIVTGDAIYAAKNSPYYLTPDGKFEVKQQSKAILHSGVEIELLPGTEVSLGASLSAYIEPFNCSNNLRSSNHSNGNKNDFTPKYYASDKFESNEQKKAVKKADILEVYPNPNNGEFYLKYKDKSSNSTCTITDITTKVVHSQDIINNEVNKLNLTTLPNGIYILNVTSNDNSTTRKIVINK